MNHPWTTHYPEGVDHQMPEITHLSLAHILEDACKAHGRAVAVECLGSNYTFADLDRRSADFAAYLQEIGLREGDRVAVMLPNVGQFPIVSLAVLRGGFASVNVNPLYTARELGHQLRDSGATAIVILESFAHTLAEIIGDTEIKHVVIARVGDILPPVKRVLINLVVRFRTRKMPRARLPGAVSFRAALRQGAAGEFRRVDAKPDDIAFIQYTGGTTGAAKGAVLTHANLVSNICQVRAYIDQDLPEADARVVQPLPLYHIFALNLSFLFLSKGYRQLLIPNPRDLKGFVKQLKSKPFAIISGVNTLFSSLADTPGFADLNFSQLRLTIGGGTATLRDTSDRWSAITGKPILEGYGLSETSPVVCVNHAKTREFTGTVGHPMPGTDLSLRDAEEKETPLGEPGEICVKGPQVFQGYWNRPQATEECFTRDGYFKTGDIGVLDEKGRLRIVDRKTDMILVSGFNVYPTEIEDVVCMMEGVLEAACIGIPDDKSGEAPKVFIVGKDPAPTAEEVLAHCRENLAAYKLPRTITFVEDLPKNTVGKVLRRELRSQENG